MSREVDAQSAETPRAGRSTGAAGLLLAVACAAEFMVVLDASVVNVALPAIQVGLGFSASGLSWVVNAYALVFAGLLLLGGRLADLFGVRGVFLTGLAIFTAASAVGGLAVSPAMLVVARGVQAAGAAVLAPASLTVLTTTFPEGTERTRALAVWTALASGGGAAGSLLGGVLTEYLSWRSTLLINLPIGLLAALAALRALPATAARGGEPRRLDVGGAGSVTLGLVALTYALTSTQEHGWSASIVLVALGVAVLALAAFVAIEACWARSPLIPLRLFSARSISVGNTSMLVAGACLMPMWYFLSLYMQQALGLSPVLTGLGFLPHTLLTVVVGARLAPWLMARLPARTLLALGSLLGAVGFWWQSCIELGDTYLGAVLGPAIVISVGTGVLNTPLTTIVTSGVRSEDAGAASGLMNTTKQVGGALGLAALLPVAAASTAGGTLQGRPVDLVDGSSTAFAVMAALLVVVAGSALLLPPAPSQH